MQDTSDNAAAAGQITPEAAEIYESFFVPALFGQFAPILVSDAHISDGDSVLDVATGTGAFARAALAAGAEVCGVDLNAGMIEVARRLAPEVEFHTAPAEALPFNEARFDAVVCQFALMFLADRSEALREMTRVCKPGGVVAVSVFDRWDLSPGYRDLIPLLDKIVGPEAAEALKAPFCIGEPDLLREVLEAGGLGQAEILHRSGTVHHASLDAWLDTEIGGWTLAEMVDADQLARLKQAAREPMAQYVADDGSVAFDAPAMFGVARLPE